MEERVVFIERQAVKNFKLKIVQYLIAKGVFPESIKFSKQEIQFKYNPDQDMRNASWSQELTDAFKGSVEFHSKFTDQLKF